MDSLPPLSEDDKRLEALKSYQILDSLPEADYNAITQLAAQICGTPVALITLVDEDRQWFKANHGFALQQTPRQVSFCTHTILEPSAAMIIEDARLDERFARNPLVTGEPQIVFYAGVPLVDEQGFALGSLCVIDHQTRQLDARQLIALQTLARQVVNLLALRKANQALLARDRQATIQIGQQRQRHQDLSQREALFRLMADAAPVLMWLLHPNGSFSYLNKTGLTYLGTTQEQMASGGWMPFLHPDQQAVFSQAVSEAIQTGEPYQGEHLLRNSQGNFRWVAFQLNPFTGPDGNRLGYVGVGTDQHEERLFQQKLQASERQLTTLFEQSPAAIAILDKTNLVFKLANPFYCALVDRSIEALIGYSLMEALPELAGQGFDAILYEVIRTGVPFTAADLPAQLMRNGQIEQIYVDLSYNPVREPDGSISGVFALVNDVTQKVVARQQIAENETMLRNAIDLAQLGTWRIDALTSSVTYSERLQSWLGIDSAVMRPEASPRIHPRDQERIRQAIVTAMQANGHFDEVYTIVHVTTGQERIIHASGQSVLDENGNVLYLAGMAQDVTLQQQLQLTLEQQVQQRTHELQLTNQDLQRSNDNLQQFAYIASHDLQEPLRKVQSFSSLLEQKYSFQLGPEGIDYLVRIRTAGERMSTLIRDLLTFSRISTRQQVFGPVSLNAIFTDVLTTLEWQIEQRQAQIKLVDLPIVNGDESQLSQLFQNLLSNALKFTPMGEVPRISVSCCSRERAELPAGVRPTSEADRFCQISIHDQGIGFDTKYLDRIFQVFQRLHGKSEFVGTGVGLAICERVMANHGGGITADSKPGQGATFCVYLPVSQISRYRDLIA